MNVQNVKDKHANQPA